MQQKNLLVFRVFKPKTIRIPDTFKLLLNDFAEQWTRSIIGFKHTTHVEVYVVLKKKRKKHRRLGKLTLRHFRVGIFRGLFFPTMLETQFFQSKFKLFCKFEMKSHGVATEHTETILIFHAWAFLLHITISRTKNFYGSIFSLRHLRYQAESEIMTSLDITASS